MANGTFLFKVQVIVLFIQYQQQQQPKTSHLSQIVAMYKIFTIKSNQLKTMKKKENSKITPNTSI